MGDPKFSRKKFERPSHPWKADRILYENELVKKYGLKNKNEIWRAQSYLRQIRGQSRTLQARVRTGQAQAEKEAEALIRRLARMGFLAEEGSTLNDVLALNLEMILGRRFQTLVYTKGLAKTAHQARQFIVHGHASISGRKVTIPGYMVTKEEEQLIAFFQRSPIASDLHPARQQEQKPGMPSSSHEPPLEFETPAPAPAEQPKAEPAPAPEKKAEPAPAPEKKPEPAAEKKPAQAKPEGADKKPAEKKAAPAEKPAEKKPEPAAEKKAPVPAEKKPEPAADKKPAQAKPAEKKEAPK